MAGRVHRSADGGDRTDAAGRSLVVHDANRADAMGRVGSQRRLDRRGIGAAPPVRLDNNRFEAESGGHLAP